MAAKTSVVQSLNTATLYSLVKLFAVKFGSCPKWWAKISSKLNIQPCLAIGVAGSNLVASGESGKPGPECSIFMFLGTNFKGEGHTKFLTQFLNYT